MQHSDGAQVCLDKARSEAHRLKGTAATVAANYLSELFCTFESNLLEGNTESAFEQVPKLQTEFENVREFVASGLIRSNP